MSDNEFRLTVRGADGFAGLAEAVMVCKECDGGTVEYALPARHSAQVEQEHGSRDCEECHDGTLELVCCYDCGTELDVDTIGGVMVRVPNRYSYPICAKCAEEETR